MVKTLVQRVVKVTPEHIKRGVQCASQTCPVALALAEVYGVVSVSPTTCHLLSPKLYVSLRLSAQLSSWIADYDSGAKVEPIDIAIDVENRRLWIA